MRPDESAAFVTKQFAFQQIRRESRTIHLQEPMFAALRQVVDKALTSLPVPLSPWDEDRRVNISRRKSLQLRKRTGSGLQIVRDCLQKAKQRAERGRLVTYDQNVWRIQEASIRDSTQLFGSRLSERT